MKEGPCHTDTSHPANMCARALSYKYSTNKRDLDRRADHSINKSIMDLSPPKDLGLELVMDLICPMFASS